MIFEERLDKLDILLRNNFYYEGDFDKLFLVQQENGKGVVCFLNEGHYRFIMNHIGEEVRDLFRTNKIGWLGLKTAPLHVREKSKVFKGKTFEPSKVQQEEKSPKKKKVELPTQRNKVIKEIEDFIFEEYEKNYQMVKEDREKYPDNYMEFITATVTLSEMRFMAKMNAFLSKIKDYDDEGE